MTVNERSRSALASEVLSSASVRIASCCCPLSTSTLAAAESSAACAPWTAATAWSRFACACSSACLVAKSLAASVVCRVSSNSMRVAAALAEIELRLGLGDGSLLGVDLMADALDGRLLGRDFLARGVGGEPVVAIVDGGDHVAGVDVAVVVDQYARQVAGDFCGQRGVVRLHVGVVGRDREAADRPPVVAEPCSGAEAGGEQGAEGKLAAAEAARAGFAARAAPPSFAGAGCAGAGAGALASAWAGAGLVGSTSMISPTFGARAGTNCREEGPLSHSFLRYICRAPLKHSSVEAMTERFGHEYIEKSEVNIDRTVRSPYIDGTENWRRITGG